ncbi:hypothetical protein AGDE_04756 [Angomonas deanei]|nr:hypothetical protein AGDE_04756 [Angomonas deanei]|eukprot:EPY39173.1 hypothetical protein AGDE_04756 [Angomonas deanei]
MTTLVALAIGAVAFYLLFRANNRREPRPPPGGSIDASNNNNNNNSINTTTRQIGRGANPSARTLPKKTESKDVLQFVKTQQLVGCKMCVAIDVLYKNGNWVEKGEEVLRFLTSTSDVFLMYRVDSEAEQKRVLEVVHKCVPSLKRHKILFCSTEKGYEAFTRQITPSLLITYNPQQASFLSGVLPYIVLVSEGEQVAKLNVASVKSVGEILP